MTRTNMNAIRVKPEDSELLELRVVRRERLSPHFMRVTLGGGDIGRFAFMGYDQWFRLFIPVSDDSLSRLPRKLNALAYARYLAISRTSRPILRNYSVRAFREDVQEMDVDFVLHGPDDGTAGPAASWARTCEAGDPVAVLDEGISFSPPPDVRHALLVADESGLPAAAGILASLPRDHRGRALLEIPSPEDKQDLDVPPGVEIDWITRDDPHAVPGRAALAAATALDLPDEPFFGWTVGEQALPVAVRRHWVKAGAPKERIMFCGYWRHTP
ncbi:siderophore-interacting protein [Actinomadura kijaniata]|uniref:NADPH-dependent ferric siderophore reductase n=1 Tax=Actinomadura namibiensis TaxID=182080 RepID=A0A7W3LM14_ACTNM|nr:siderophore-interacting protein [Actinomadura namibiensis]MBA8950574.1 NADPH-dependent ferric siderophore reductase [Actinomadura namibiensis]